MRAVRRIAGWAVAAAVVAASGPLAAQGPEEARGAPAGRFDFYVLALTWSPGLCALEGARDRPQCASDSKLGFVVHGLWPQYERGYPAYCRVMGGSPPAAYFEAARLLFPDERVARQQWHKHGACTGLSPADYLEAVRRARSLVRVPAELERPAAAVKVLAFEIERAFTAANPGLKPDMLTVNCRRRIFHEVRVCLDRDLRGFRSCPEVDRDGCRSGEVVVEGIR